MPRCSAFAFFGVLWQMQRAESVPSKSAGSWLGWAGLGRGIALRGILFTQSGLSFQKCRVIPVPVSTKELFPGGKSSKHCLELGNFGNSRVPSCL